MTSQYRYDIIIIGAGISGLASGKYLQSKGFNVVLLEARNRIGGRLWSDNSLGVTVDLGAAWIHGVKNSSVYDLATKYGVKVVPFPGSNSLPNIVYDHYGNQVKDKKRLKKMWERWDTFEEFLNIKKQEIENKEDISIQDVAHQFIKSQNFSERQLREFNFSLIWNIESFWATDLSNLSLKYYCYGQDTFKGGDVLIPDGYKQILNPLSKGLDIRLSHNVQKIDYGGQFVCVKTDNGYFESKYALITLPLFVLKKGNVEFNPHLPKKKNYAISNLGKGILNKTYLLFPKVFWQKNEKWIAHIPKEKSRWSMFMNLCNVVNKPVLIALNFASSGLELEQLPDDETISDVMNLLRKCYGQNISEPDDFLVTRWNSDEFSKGSYSFTPVGQTSPDLYNFLADPIMNKIFFAGEATDPVKYGTSEGALNSGIREAKRICALNKN